MCWLFANVSKKEKLALRTSRCERAFVYAGEFIFAFGFNASMGFKKNTPELQEWQGGSWPCRFSQTYWKSELRDSP